jgi:hypothetical protein
VGQAIAAPRTAALVKKSLRLCKHCFFIVSVLLKGTVKNL